jgi:hypothetical protein
MIAHHIECVNSMASWIATRSCPQEISKSKFATFQSSVATSTSCGLFLQIWLDTRNGPAQHMIKYIDCRSAHVPESRSYSLGFRPRFHNV